MPRTKDHTAKPTAAELEVLNVLWDRGPSTVRQVYKVLTKQKGELAYTTVLKTLQNMSEKKLVTRDVSQRSHVYAARTERKHEQTRAIQEVKRKLFGGRLGDLVETAVSSERPTPQELEEICERIGCNPE